MKRTKRPRVAKLKRASEIELYFGFDQKTLDIVRSLPGRRFIDQGRKHWVCQTTPATIEILKQAGFTLRIAPSLLTKGLKRELFEFQQEGVILIEALGGRALLADEMGLGKTIQAIAWLYRHPELRPVVVVCPAHLKLNWAAEIEKTLPGRPNVQVLFGSDHREPLTGDIIIINYDILCNQYEPFKDSIGRKRFREKKWTGWVDYLIKLGPTVVIIDEAHYIKHNSAFRTKSTKKLARKVPYVLTLTGTPIPDRPIDGFNILQITNREAFPDFWDYANRYCDAKPNGFGWDFKGAINKEDLHRKLTERLMIRRLKRDQLKDLPDKIYSFIPFELSNRAEYEAAERDFMKFLRATRGASVATKAKRAQHLVKIETLKQLAVKGKMRQAIQWIRDVLDENEKLVVFAIHKAVVSALMAEFGKIAVKFVGGMSDKAKAEAVKAFQEDKSIKLFVGNIEAAGTGITLTAASSVAMLELPWKSDDLKQPEDRLHRIGQTETVNVYYLLAYETIEETIAKILDEKRKVSTAILDGEEVEETQLLTELMKAYLEGERANDECVESDPKARLVVRTKPPGSRV